MMNKTFFISMFCILCILTCPAAFAGDFFLKQTLFEGESEQYNVGGYVYNVKLLSVFDTKMQAQFEVNGEKTDFLREDESHKLSDGAVIQVRDIMPQEAGEGSDLVQYNFFPAEHPEPDGTGQTNVTSKVSSAPAEEPAQISEVSAAKASESAKEVRAAPAKDAKIDITKKQSTDSWWESMINWLKSLFK